MKQIFSNVCSRGSNIFHLRGARELLFREKKNDRTRRNRKNENHEKSYHGARGIKFFLSNSLFSSRVMVILTRRCTAAGGRSSVILRTRRSLEHVSGLSSPEAPLTRYLLACCISWIAPEYVREYPFLLVCLLFCVSRKRNDLHPVPAPSSGAGIRGFPHRIDKKTDIPLHFVHLNPTSRCSRLDKAVR